MSLKEAVEFLIEHGYTLLFGWVLVEQMGLPIPAIPLLLAAGALAGSAKMDLALAASWALIGERGPIDCPPRGPVASTLLIGVLSRLQNGTKLSLTGRLWNLSA